jgi:hypothetical protein
LVDQPLSPGPKRSKVDGKLTFKPAAGPGQNKLKPNDRAIEGKGDQVGPETPHTDTEPKRKESDEKILERLRKRMERCIAAEADQRKDEVDDRKFKAGQQWPADILAQRNTDRRPALTFNRMLTFVHQITNPARENRPSILVSPVGDRSDKDGAKMFRGLIRRVERDSHADIAYDNSLDDAVTSGRGYIRLTTEWASETSFDLVAMIKRVRNPFTVYLDPDRMEPDGSDARYGFVTEMVPRDEFENEYPGCQMIPFEQGGQGDKWSSWSTEKGVRVAEYFEVVTEPRELIELSNGWIGWEDEMDDLTAFRLKKGTFREVNRRTSQDRKVMHYKASGVEIIEEAEWPGKWIPIIPVIGDEIDVEGKVRYSGVIRNAKDAQRMLNYWATFITEQVALAPKSHWLIAEGQDEGYENEWKTANTKPRQALHYKVTDLNGTLVPPPQRIAPGGVPEGAQLALVQSQQEMMATTGIRFDSTLQERLHDESGRAIKELARHTDVGAFHYVDNLRRSMEFLGKQLIDLLPKILTRKQVVTILREDDTEQQVTVDPNLPRAYQEVQGKDGMMRYFNPRFGEYGVTVDIGPSYATKRQEAAESMMDFVKAMPNTAQLVMDLIASEMDWPGAEKIAARLAKAIPAQLLTADMKDIPPQIQALIQNLEAQSKQMQQQLQAAAQELNDKGADRQIALRKIESDFEAKILQIIAKTEAEGKRLAVEQGRFVAETLIEEMRSERAQMHEREMAAMQPQQTEEKPKGPSDG